MRTDLSGVDVTIPFETHMVNVGNLYYVSYVVTGSAALRSILFRVGAKPLHISMELKAGLATPKVLKEGVAVTVAGTALDRRNHNRRYNDNDTLVTVFTGATYTGGTIIKSNQAGFGTTPGLADSGEGDGGSNYIFKENTDYAIEFTPTAAADTVFIASFYEEVG